MNYDIPENEKKILEEVELYRDRYFTYDLPVPFDGLFLYPVTVRNYNEFMVSNACLLLNKKDDPMGMKYTNLEYLLSKFENQQDGFRWSFMFSRILELCLHISPGMKCHKCGKIIPYETFLSKENQEKYANSSAEEQEKLFDCDCGGKLVASLEYKKDEKTGRCYFVIDGVKVDNDSFNRMRKFILYQNLPDYYDDTYVPKAVRDDEAKKNEILSKDSGKATLEDKICAIAFQLGITFEDVYNLTIRKFVRLVSLITEYPDYVASKVGLMTGMVKLKDGQQLDHWLFKKNNGNRYGAKTSAEELIKNVSNV